MNRHTIQKRKGSRLQDGKDHANDHLSWSRRDFMSAIGASVSGAIMLGATPVRALGGSFYSSLQQTDSDRILVLVQLDGGNDGLNTVVPVEDDEYYAVRPGVAIKKVEALKISDLLGFHPSFESLMPLYNEGQMAVLQNVGYPEQDLSHFRSTDIWMSASAASDYVNTGWVGRSMAERVGGDVQLLDYPLAVQLGRGVPLLLKGEERSMGMSVNSTSTFDRLIDSGKFYDESAVSDSVTGNEISFVRSVANDAFRYASAIQEAANAGGNSVEYPNSNLSENLAIVARLIKGNLGAKIYHVVIGGFDTHANQPNRHAELLKDLAEAVAAFQADISAGGWQEQVLTMTFSEFGRRVEENASFGTDHGTAAPLFLFGPSIAGGLYGSNPDLLNVDRYGNLTANFNFRNVYSTVLQDWFGFSPEATASIIGEAFPSLNFVSNPIFISTEQPSVSQGFDLKPNYPNPFTGQTTLSFSLAATTNVRLRVFDAEGREVKTVLDRTLSSGSHEVVFQSGGLPSGRYFYRLETPEGGSSVRAMTIVR